MIDILFHYKYEPYKYELAIASFYRNSVRRRLLQRRSWYKETYFL